MLNKFCGLLFVTCILFSCQKTEQKRILDIVKEWDGKEITFPTHSIFTIQGYDTISYKITAGHLVPADFQLFII